MLKEYPKFARGEAEKLFKGFPKTEQKLIEDYIFYRKAAGLGDASDLRRYVIQIRHIIDCNFKDFTELEQHTRLIVLIKDSHLSNEVKKNMKINLNNLFGEFLFEDWWSIKFRKIYSNKKLKGEGSEKKKIKMIPTDEEFEKMLKSETSVFYKTFLLVQESTGLRTKECRCIELEKIKFEEDNTGIIGIYMTKTGEEADKTVFTNKQTTDFIKKLIEELKNTDRYKKYLFPSPKDLDQPIHKNTINKWFRNLSFKSTGKHYTNYSLRHKKSKMLYELADKNIISENTALKLLGHGRSQKERYVNRPKEEDIKILKEQAFNTEISDDEKNELRIEINKLRKLLIESMGFDAETKEKLTPEQFELTKKQILNLKVNI